jgi:hypothetical protein
MPLDLNELEDAVLALPPERRGYLLDRLLASLDDVADSTDPKEVERAWIEEADHRYQEYLTGEVGTITAAEALGARGDGGHRCRITGG